LPASAFYQVINIPGRENKKQIFTAARPWHSTTTASNLFINFDRMRLELLTLVPSAGNTNHDF
jgi:hypothetical protein